ncbi:LPS export ABC transporter periplasmic protein LptC [Oceanicaulis alexandrii]|uniref:LPS export ABC transporter periplasmic protein LptC n=1 Tax=Oceanicaulis alexandrii TaxID=153233 RepID=UPI0023558BBA|nr:LPS export ABC transporter periplasmic protein LptC [Oceanicaulis alexandrii]
MSAALIHADGQMIGQRRAKSLADARRRSRFVAGLRGVLIAAAVLVALNALIQMVLSGGTDSPATDVAISAGAGESERIINPRFTGRDEGGVPYVITAETAERRRGAEQALTDLERPTLDYALLDGGEDASRVLAEHGVFDDANLSLQLDTNVRLTTRSGYVFDTQSATLFLREGVVTGPAPMHGLAPWGAVRADRFEVRDDGQHIILEGDVRTRFDASSTPTATEVDAGAGRSEENEP